MKLVFPDFSTRIAERLPYDAMARVQARAIAEIQAAEDKVIFEALDGAVRKCWTEGHPGYDGPAEDCDHPDCVAAHVHDS